MKTSHVVLLALLFAVTAWGGAYRPEDILDATYWKSLDDATKAIFLKGASCAVGLQYRANQPGPLVLSGREIPKLIPVLDQFYAEPKNQAIFVRQAIEIGLMKLSGKPEKEVEAATTQARNLSLSAD